MVKHLVSESPRVNSLFAEGLYQRILLHWSHPHISYIDSCSHRGKLRKRAAQGSIGIPHMVPHRKPALS